MKKDFFYKIEQEVSDLVENYNRNENKGRFTLLDILISITYIRAEKSIEELKLLNVNLDFKEQWNKNLIRMIKSIELPINLEIMKGNLLENKDEVSLQALDIEIPKGYILYDEFGHNADYLIEFGLTREEAYSKFKNIIDGYSEIGIMLKEDRAIEYGTSF